MLGRDRRLFGLLCLLVAGCALAGPGDEEQTEDQVERPTLPIVGGSEATAYPEAVLINMLQGGQTVSYCSGSLIAPQLVLTAGHCVLQFQSFEVIAPYASPEQSSHASQSATFDYTETGDTVNPNQHDVGVILLDTPINIPSYFTVAAQAVAFGTQAHNLGRLDNGQLSQTSLFMSDPLAMKDGSQIGFPLDYYSDEVIQPGDSGGPVVLPGAAPRTVIAVNSGAGQGTEVLARVDLVASWLQDQINGGGGGSGGSGGGGGNGGSGGGQPPPPPPPGGCDHDVCTWGAPLEADCDMCTGIVCQLDAYCCDVEWDPQCIGEAAYICGAQCQ